MSATRAVGRYGEDVAVRHLLEAGLEVIERNWRCSTPEVRGELDVVAYDPAESCLVVVEVKTRRSERAGHPAESITPAKLRRLRHLAALWCLEHRPAAAHLRLDVVAVTASGRGAAQVTHLRAVG